jgi:D-alanyl-lipoteichoic acid acyltransferase DltB (MBOAT superfamily)
MFVAPAYAHPAEASAGALIVATVCFACQIYCDFSGYSDIAIGCAEVMGFRLMRNFRNPYLSTSIAEFWKRWHISLSSWFRDYVFLPLGYALFRRVKRRRTAGIAREVWIYAAASLVTMALSGLWHGAAWTFVVWGVLHGVYLAAGHLVRRGAPQPPVSRFATLWRIVFTFVLVSVAWVFFRAASMHDAVTILSRMATAWAAAGPGSARDWLMVADPLLLTAVMVVLTGVIWVEWLDERQSLRTWFATASQPARIGVYCTLGLLILLFARADQQAPFIYFQF